MARRRPAQQHRLGAAGDVQRRSIREGLGIAKTKGNKHRRSPDEEAMWRMLAKAHDLTPPSFADYLEVVWLTGMRPGELDALQWPQIPLGRRRDRRGGAVEREDEGLHGAEVRAAQERGFKSISSLV
jgi:integrase